jgi:hypothetical protein
VLDVELAGQQRSNDACLRLRPVKRTDRDDGNGRRIEPAWRLCVGQPSGPQAIAGRGAEHQLTSSEHDGVATRRCLDYSLLACDYFRRGDIESCRSVRRCIAQRVLMWHPVVHPTRPNPSAESVPYLIRPPASASWRPETSRPKVWRTSDSRHQVPLTGCGAAGGDVANDVPWLRCCSASRYASRHRYKDCPGQGSGNLHSGRTARNSRNRR